MTDKIVKFSDLSYYDGKIKQYINSKNLILITHSELVALRDASLLVPGQFYQITDYITTTCQPHTRSVGIRFDIIVQAIAKDTLAVDAVTTAHDFHCNDEGYSSEINPYTGVAYSKSKDQYNADAFWHGIYDRPFTEHANENNRIKYYIDGKGIYFNGSIEIYGYAWPYYWLGTEKYILVDRGSDFIKRYQYVGETTIDGSTYYEWSAYDQVYTTSATPQLGDTIYNNTGTALTYSLYRYIELEHKGVIVEMEDKFHNVCGYDFKNIQYERDADFIAVYGRLSNIINGSYCLTNTESYDGYYYTFNVWYNNNMYNATMFTESSGSPMQRLYLMATNNKIPAHYHNAWTNDIPEYTNLYDGTYMLPNNIMFAFWYGASTGGGSESDMIKDNTFSNRTRDNTFGVCNKINTVSCNCYNNVIDLVVKCNIQCSRLHDVVVNNLYNTDFCHCADIQTIQGGGITVSRIFGSMNTINIGEYRLTYNSSRSKIAYSTIIGTFSFSTLNRTINYSTIQSVNRVNISLGTDCLNIYYNIHNVSGTEASPINIVLSEPQMIYTEITTNSNGDVVQYCPADFYSIPMTTAEIDDEVDKITINN